MTTREKTSSTEEQLVRRIAAELESRGAWYFKTHGSQFQPAGLPDIVACYRGRFVGIEAKVKGNTATPIQLWELDRIRKAGGISGVVYSLEEARDLLDGKTDPRPLNPFGDEPGPYDPDWEE